MTVIARLFTAAALLGAAGPACALGQNNYDNVGAYLALREVGEGLVVAGSLEHTERFYGLASLALLSEADIDITRVRGGGGINLPIETTVPGLSFAADAALAYTSTEGAGDDLTLELRGGAHYRLADGVTAGAFLTRVEGDRKDTYLAADLRYRFQPQWVVHGGFDWSDNDGIYAGVEYLFSR